MGHARSETGNLRLRRQSRQGRSHYWVFAHVTPTLDDRGNIIGYHSNRRKPESEPVERIKPIYKALCAEEARHANAKQGMSASLEMMVGLLKQNGVAYDEFVLSL